MEIPTLVFIYTTGREYPETENISLISFCLDIILASVADTSALV